MTDIADISGIIPECPIILCRNKTIAEIISAWVHTYSSKIPKIQVVEEGKWPKDIVAGALVVTPLGIGFSEKLFWDFSMPVVGNLSKGARQCLDAAIRISLQGDILTYRILSNALSTAQKQINTRQVGRMVSELRDAGLVKIDKKTRRMTLTFGRWRPDATTAEAAGIEIKRYE
jgi:hypothetical protein